MEIRIEKLRPELADQYIDFFDHTDHDDGIDEHKCYCCCWSADSCQGKDFSRVENRRRYAREYVMNEKIQGYLAYDGDRVVGWCNTNNKEDCLQCESWRRFMEYVPRNDLAVKKKVKSIFCFVIAPDMRRKGIATKLLGRICKDAKKEGYDAVEAYPYLDSAEQTAFTGYVKMYQKCGFEIALNDDGRLVMRKELVKKSQYLITERAHYMCPKMHFGMVIELAVPYEKQKLVNSLNRLSEAHPFLKSLIREERGTSRLYYGVTGQSQIQLMIQENENTMWEDYKVIGDQEWNVFEQGLLKVLVYPKKDGVKILFVTHHLLVDGRGLLQIAEEFANDYVEGIYPTYVEEQLLERIEDLPVNSKLSGISRLLVHHANHKWKKEHHAVSYKEYCKFASEYNTSHPTKYNTYQLDTKEVSEMVQICHEHQITMNDLLMATMYQKAKTDKVILAVDIRKYDKGYRQGALGNYATAMGIVCKSKKKDVVELAKEVHQLVKKQMKNPRTFMLVLACYFELDPTLLDAAVITALGGFQSKAANLVGNGMFHMAKPSSYSITNLGNVKNKNIKAAMFIPPASPAAKLTLGVVTMNGVLCGCCSLNGEE